MCNCDCANDNPYRFIDESTQRARKPRKCSECSRASEIGERHRHIFGRWADSGAETFRWCVHCVAAQEIAASITGCHCYCFTALWESIDEEARERQKNVVLCRLVISARHRWAYQRGPRKGQLMPIPVAVLVAS
jgi:hypothetical protein